MARQVGEDRRKDIGSDAVATVDVHRDGRLHCVARELGAGVAHAALEDESPASCRLRFAAMKIQQATSTSAWTQESAIRLQTTAMTHIPANETS